MHMQKNKEIICKEEITQKEKKLNAAIESNNKEMIIFDHITEKTRIVHTEY